jgi:uncharacterized protein YqhQ
VTEPTTSDEPLRLGGMALRNGLLVHGPTSWAAAVRDDAGAVRTASGTKPRLRGAVAGLPLARGPVKLAEAMLVIPLVKRALPEARLPFQDATVLAAMAGASLAGTALRRRRGTGLGTEALVAGISVLPSLLALRGGELAQYHGAEHKTIGAYETAGADAAAETSKEHDRCGSHLITPLLAANLAGTALLRQVVERPTALHGAMVSVGAVGVAVEVFSWSERHGDTRAAELLRRPGHELQRVLGTREPDAGQLEVGRAALDAILAAEAA